MEYTSVNNILSKFHRDLRGTDINESDAIEWIGEALEFLKVREIQEEDVDFIKVENYECNVPIGLQTITQIAKDNDSTFKEEDVTDIPQNLNYNTWTVSNFYQKRFTPVRLANHSFFKSVVCKEKDMSVYESCNDEYTIVGTVDRKLRFSFKTGVIALAYVRNAIDKETGYPLVPDNISYTTAITYYIKWKIAQRMEWSGREGYSRLAQDSERLWLKYCQQGKNYMKMPKTLDQYQNMLESSHHLIPKHNRYYNYFGNLGRPEQRKFNDPDRRSNNYGLNININ